MLNRRQRHILKYLIDNERFVAVRDLAEMYKVSERSIRYDLDAIDYDVKKNGLALDRHKQRGVRLVLPKEERDRWLNRLAGEPDYSNRLSAEERRNTILGVLFHQHRPVSSTDLADLLHVSRRTVVKDLKRVEAWLEQHQLSLTYVQNKGFRITGSERDVRMALADLVSKQPHDYRDFPFKMTGLADEHLDVVRDAVFEHVRTLPYELTDSSLDGLIFHIAVALQRLRKGHEITMPERELAELKSTEEFKVSRSIAKSIASGLNVPIPEAEAGYMTLHLLGAKLVHKHFPVSGSLEEPVKRFIQETGARLGTDLTKDRQLIQGLMIHLRPTLYRLKFNLRLNNPLKDEIMHEYTPIVEAIDHSVSILEDAFHTSFNDDERAYLALHIGAALERQSVAAERKQRILLVCGSGVGTAQLLLSRIRRYFPDLEIVDTRPLYHVTPEWLQQEQVDWIISTIPIHGLPVPHIVVNPFLTVQDRQKITSLLQHAQENQAEERMAGPVLEDVLAPELIRLDVEVENWQEAVRQAGQLLVDHNQVEPRYVDAMVHMVEENGPYIVIDKGVAMPHARPEDGVKSLGLSLLRLSNPVNFGHEKNDPVKLVIGLSSVDAEMHLNALRQLARLLSDKQNKEVLLTGGKQKILDKVQEASQT